MARAELVTGEAAAVLREREAGSVQTVVTSPPYFRLRDYGHPDQLGCEDTVEEYVDRLVAIMREVRRVLREDGTVWLNLGDSYSTSANAGSSANRTGGRAHKGGVMPARVRTTDLAPRKSLLMVPSRVAIALAGDGWLVRNELRWVKSNAMPHPVSDRLQSRSEHLYLLAKSARYYFDREALAAIDSPLPATGDTWVIPVEHLREEHEAMMPYELARRCLIPSTRVPTRGREPDLVLDPFAGTSTTGLAARDRGLGYLGIDLQASYTAIGAARLGGRRAGARRWRDSWREHPAPGL